MAHVLSKSNTTFHAVEAAAAFVLKTVGGFFSNIIAAQSRAHIFEELTNLTDRELADRYGINRDQIVSYVFSDKIG